MESKNYSQLDNDTPLGFKEIGIPHVKKGQVLVFQGTEGLLRAKTDAYLEEGAWVIEVETEDFEDKKITYRKTDLAYAPKLWVEPTKS